jgi:diguanylate cyclase (GGDEF)-like protein
MSDVAKRLEKADKYLQKGKIEDALQELLRANEEDPANEPVAQKAADLCVSLNRKEDATRLLAFLFDKQAGVGDMAKANITYKKLQRFTTPTPDQTYRWAQFTEKSNKKEALEAYRNSLDGFTKAGRKAEALAVMKKLVALEPSSELYQKQGALAAELNDGRTAAAAYYQVGKIEVENQRDGFSWFQQANAHDSSNSEVAVAYAWSLLHHNDPSTALAIIEPFAKQRDAGPERREAYGRALMALRRAKEAEPLIWELFLKDPAQIDEVLILIGTLIDIQEYHHALEVAQRLDANEEKAGRRKEFVTQLKAVTDAHPPNAEFLEFMVALFNANNREHDYCETLGKLFELYYAAGNFLKAGDSLDAAAEVDPYEKAHQKRLEMLKGKIDGNRFRAIANRFSGAKGGGSSEEQPEKPVDAGEPTILEDFMLQAEIFLQYSMRSKAVERLERVSKLFPREEEKNEKLRSLYMSAGFMPKYADGGSSAAVGAPNTVQVQMKTVPTPAAGIASQPTVMFNSPAARPPATPPAGTPAPDGNDVNDIARVTEITRNIYRQANVKGVLFAAVNDIGRHWNASRCVAGLCTPGKPPSAALEYCAPGIKQSDVMAIVKLIGAMQQQAVAKGTVSIQNAKAAPELNPIRPFVDSLQVESLLAVPLLDGEEHQGILILEQCGAPRVWRPTDALVLKTIADQMMLAVNNSKLRNLMKTLAVTDEKSGLLKRASYIDVLLSETRRALEQNSTASVMLLHFGKASALVKEIGENAVETMMQQVGQVVCSHIRQNDVAVRYELTTIAVVLADTNDKNAFFVVDKLRKVLTATKVPGKDRSVPMTVGIAEAVVQSKFDPIDIVTEVINRAEHALEVAKAEGPNKAQSVAPMLEAAAVA